MPTRLHAALRGCARPALLLVAATWITVSAGSSVLPVPDRPTHPAAALTADGGGGGGRRPSAVAARFGTTHRIRPADPDAPTGRFTDLVFGSARSRPGRPDPFGPQPPTPVTPPPLTPPPVGVPSVAVPPVGVPPVAVRLPGPLPAPRNDDRHVDIVLTPHPDDETLSLGVWTANAVDRGDRVIVVALTDGRSTGASPTIATRLGKPFGRDQVAAARIRELRAAVADLGVAPADVYLAHLDGERTLGGSRLTVDEAGAVVRAFAARFPDATFATMSWIAERHPDHLSIGQALWQAQRSGLVTGSVFAVSRLWWALPSPAVGQVLPSTLQVRRRVLAAADAYDLWDPREQRYAVGWTSVHSQFTAMLADPRDRVHGWAATPPAQQTSTAQLDPLSTAH